MTCGAAGLPGGPAGVVSGALAGAAVWLAGGLVARAAAGHQAGDGNQKLAGRDAADHSRSR